MKLKNIINTLTVAAVALVAAACNDTDAQYSIPDVDAPQFVSAALTADQPIYFGETTIQVTFDQNVNFATKNTSQITVNGAAADKALVLGASKVLTVTKTLDFSNTLTLHIPAGLVIIEWTNVVRICGVLLMQVFWPNIHIHLFGNDINTFHLAHDYVFKLFFYLIIFLMWVLWVEKFYNPSLKAKQHE